jgi:hypothetical protein
LPALPRFPLGLPKTPFDAGVISAKHGIAERDRHEKGEAGNQHPAPGILCRGDRGQRAERNREIIGVALLEAERTGTDIKHQLKEPRARQRCHRNGRDRQRRRQRRMAGLACIGGARGGVECHVDLLYKPSYPARPMLSRRTAITLECLLGVFLGVFWSTGEAGWTIGILHVDKERTRGLTGRARPLYSARFATSALSAEIRKPLWRNW